MTFSSAQRAFLGAEPSFYSTLPEFFGANVENSPIFLTDLQSLEAITEDRFDLRDDFNSRRFLWRSIVKPQKIWRKQGGTYEISRFCSYCVGLCPTPTKRRG